MSTQNSLPKSFGTALSFASEHGEGHDRDLTCNWACCDGTWQKSSKRDRCSCCMCRSLSSSAGTPNISRTSSDILTVNNMDDSSSPKSDGYVYKRRKLQGIIVALLSEENASTRGSAGYHSSISSDDHPLPMKKDVCERSLILNADGNLSDLYKGNPSISIQNHAEMPPTVISSHIDETTCIKSVPNSVPINTCSMPKAEYVEASINNFYKSASEHYSGFNDRCSSSKSDIIHASAFNRSEVDNGECSSSDIFIAKPLGEFTSAKELCISLLKNHGLLEGASGSSACASLEILGNDDPKSLQSCKICGLMENPLKMLICDLCEEAFHVSCCNPKLKELPVDEWYCQSCFTKRPKPLLGYNTGKSWSEMDLGPILSMLRENQPRRSSVRIGYDFQVEVPEWSGLVSNDDDDYFAESAKLDSAESSSLNGWDCDKPSKPNSIGNWVQCREVIYKDDNREETVCGKWRRAPLFAVQTNDWDCSCSVLWDPIHADCAVPQELETEEVLRHLKYIEMLRPRLASRQKKPSQTSSGDHE